MLFTPLPPFPPPCVGSFFSFLFSFLVVITCKIVSLLFELAFIDKQIGSGCCDPSELGPEIASLLNPKLARGEEVSSKTVWLN